MGADRIKKRKPKGKKRPCEATLFFGVVVVLKSPTFGRGGPCYALRGTSPPWASEAFGLPPPSRGSVSAFGLGRVQDLPQIDAKALFLTVGAFLP